MKTNINIFDFDDTLFRVPSFLCESSKNSTPYQWYDDPISLKEPNLPKPIKNIVEKTWNKSRNDKNYLITHRVKACESEINNLLDSVNCEFEERFFLGRVDNKAIKVLEILDKNPQCKKLTIYEDSLFEIINYAAILDDELSNEIEVAFVFVDKRKVISFPLSIAIKLTEYTDIEKIFIVI